MARLGSARDDEQRLAILSTVKLPLGRRTCSSVPATWCRFATGLRSLTPLCASVVKSCPAVLSHGEDYILYSILDFIVDNYTPVVEALHAEVEETEETVFSKAGAPVNVQRLYMVRRDLLRLRNAVVPLVDVCRRLEHAEVIAIDAAMQPLFRDVTDHILRVQEEIDSLREVLAFAFEASLMTGQAQQTAITRKLAAWAAILAVPTAIAGTVPARCAAEVARCPGREGLVAPRQEWHGNYGADTGVERKWPSAALLTSRSRHDA